MATIRSNNSFLANTIAIFFYGLPLAAWKGILINMMESLLVGICFYLTIYFVGYLNLSVIQSGTLMSCYGVGTVIGGLIGGKLSDKFSPGIISAASLFLQSFMYLLLANNHQFNFLLINLLFMGIGSYSFITSNHLWILARCKDNEMQRLKAINVLGVGSNLGIGLSGIIISFFALSYFTHLFLFSSLLLLIVGIYFVLLESKEPKHTHATNLINKNIQPNNVEINKQRNDKIIVGYVLGSLFLVGIIVSQLSSTYPLFLVKSFPELGIKSYSILFTINAMMVVLLQSVTTNILKNINKIVLVGTGAFLFGLGMLILNFSYVYEIAIVSIIITTIGEILFFSVAQSICYERSSAQSKGQSLGLYRMIYAGSRVIGPIVGGGIYEKTNSGLLWTFCFILGLLCIVPATFLKKYD